jgi:hypothetical protein
MNFTAKGPRTAQSLLWVFLTLTSTVVCAFALGGCTTDAYCFTDCNSGGAGVSSGNGSTSATSTGSNDDPTFTSGAGNGAGNGAGSSNGSSGSGGCVTTNGGTEICDGLDNDCNNLVDDLPGLDLTSPKSCGTCLNDCNVNAINCDSQKIGCAAGVCTCGQCAADYYDTDKNGSCEYYCVKDPGVTDDSVCNNKDDDCDGLKDEDVNFCTLTDCGKCGGNCVVLHGTPSCVQTGADCKAANNAHCEIKTCECTSIGNCWYDLDGSAATGCEYQCDATGVELCGDSIDNDCDGKIDEADDLSGDQQIGKPCSGDPDGECAAPAHAGTTQCIGNKVVCAGPNVIKENDVEETCNTKDDNCDGLIDNNAKGTGDSCGISNKFPCSLGTIQCQNGTLGCIGATDPGTETCNGQDDDCDGFPDQTNGMPPPDSVGTCNVPLPPPAGATSPCKGGVKACVGGTVQCQGSAGPTGTFDTCGVDANCDGTLTNQPDLQNDVHNCGTCGKDCLVGAVHANFACVTGACQFQGCQGGFVDLNGDQQCEYACTFVSTQEACNGTDDNCNGQIDESITIPSPTQVCGVSPSATSPECTTGVTVVCQAGAFKCTFPAGVCTAVDGAGKPNCLGTAEICDTPALDNDCDGLLNENVPNFGAPCASDDGKAPPGDGACRGVGTFVCNGTTASVCTAVKNNGAAGAELCDGVDNDCDGSVDEAFNAKGTNATFFVKPDVTKIANNLWIMSHEASRPNADGIVPGTGNGFFTSAPAGTTLDKTRACSAPGKIPWFNVTGTEVEQTCAAIGGTVCTTGNWQTACRANNSCKWGYAPRTPGTACTTVFAPNPPNNPGKFCNLGISYDYSPGVGGDQDGLLPTGSPLLSQCFADWIGLQGNVAGNGKIFDITGNLREIVKIATNQYNLFGGAFDSQSDDGSSCDFNFYVVDQNFKFFDTGFRCCFTSDPTL